MTMSRPDFVPDGYVKAAFDLGGRTAVVTGGGSGLGAAIAIGFAQAGMRVVVVDVNLVAAETVAGQIRGEGGWVVALPVDVTSSDSVTSLDAKIADSVGPVDVLVNSAGSAFRCPAEDFPEERFDQIIALNLKGTFLACQAFGRRMLREGRGSIINITSIGSESAYPHAAAYQASKGAVKQLTKALALEWRSRGVRVNCIAPTLMDSPLTTSVEATSTVTSDFIRARMIRSRLGQPRELIGAAVFLASDASELVTGHTIMCDDGYTIA